MVYNISNDYFQIGVKSYGAELSSIFEKKSGFEFLWQGNPDVWYGQSPILFPIVGRLDGDKYLYNGKEYSMPKHGFARKTEFALESSTEGTLTFKLSSSEETKNIYPFDFDLFVIFKLYDNSLEVTHKVVNKGENEMLFSLGAHPGFNCEIGDKLIFEKNETLSTEKINADSLRLKETFPVLDDSNEIEITKDIFNEDALILSNIKSKEVTLKSDNHNRTTEFYFGDAPYLGIWAKPGAPYVCIEPWYGVNDSVTPYGEFKNKQAINLLPAGQEFVYSWKAVFTV